MSNLTPVQFNPPENEHKEERLMIITPTTNKHGEIDYGHAWRYYQMGFTDQFGNPIQHETKDEDWRVLPNKTNVLFRDAYCERGVGNHG